MMSGGGDSGSGPCMGELLYITLLIFPYMIIPNTVVVFNSQIDKQEEIFNNF